jgi:sporulation protein YlmC with PRC-barrel domain
MLKTSIAAGLAGSLLLASAAFAQTPTTTTDKADTASKADTAASAAPSSFQGDWRASKIAGLNVYNESNESIGSISDLLMDKSGNVKAAVISVGGFLGVGAHLVAVPYDKIKFVNQPVASTTASSAPAGTRPASNTTTGSAANPPATTTATKSNPWYPDHAVFSATKDELKAMPEFKYE